MSKIKCMICNDKFNNFKYLSYHLRSHQISSKEYYDKYLKKEGEGTCPMYGYVPSCKKETKFNRIYNGYLEYCSRKCMLLSEKTINKRKETNLEKYGNICSLHGKDIKEKTKKTWNEKYGGNPLSNDIIRKKIKNTITKKYDVEYPYQIHQNKLILKIDKLLSDLNLKMLSKYDGYKNPIKVQCQSCDLIFETSYNNLCFNNCGKCPNCYPKNKSSYEYELAEFIKSLDLEIIENSNKIISPYELDIYIKDKNIAIEFNGLYWHSENKVDKYYHLNKTNLCKLKNIKLIHIFEDEWVFKQDIVKSRLKQIIGINDIIRIHARKCEIKEIDPKTKNKFLNKYHIQGDDKSNIKLGMFNSVNELISVMTFSHGSLSRNNISNDDIWELSRFCSNYNYRIPGAASKLLSYFKRNYKWKKIYSYADIRWSDGNVYYKIGFELDLITKPNYWYSKGLERIHRFNLRKRLNEPKNISELMLRIKEGYFRIWDCGHLKFVLNNIIFNED